MLLLLLNLSSLTIALLINVDSNALIPKICCLLFIRALVTFIEPTFQSEMRDTSQNNYLHCNDLRFINYLFLLFTFLSLTLTS